MNDFQICHGPVGGNTPNGDDCKWVAWAVGRGVSLMWYEVIIRDLMLAGY